jgi:hypothetical protein
MKTQSKNNGRGLSKADANDRSAIMKLRYIDYKDKERSVWVKIDDSGEVWIEPHLFVHELAVLCSGEPMKMFGKWKHPLMRASWLRTQCSGTQLDNLNKLSEGALQVYNEALAAKEAVE